MTAMPTPTHVLRVEWPIHDDRMLDDEAIASAWFDWPHFPEKHQVTVVGTPTMRVEPIPAERQRQTRATRAVVCEAPVIARISTASISRKAA
ncbi:hypothetical protein ACIA5D_17775 [Actinoplanes sp. NPDC051513]|uniref:hypothetical protein n=1 Tax=Actinoplanes sp. NPDC051513 TaxID=3363908 RepID=UPI0037A7D792